MTRTRKQSVSDAKSEVLENATANRVLDRIIFCGNTHQTVPRALFYDRRLTPLERNAWQALRMLISESGVAEIATYTALRPLIASIPCGPLASDESISRALTLLRLSRWITVIRQPRDSASGRLRGSLYLLHDSPLSPYEASEIDSEYVALIGNSVSHASKSVQRVAYETLSEVTRDPEILQTLPAPRLQRMIAQVAEYTQQRRRDLLQASDPQPSSDSEDGRFQNVAAPRIPRTPYSTSSTLSTNNKESTVPTPSAIAEPPTADLRLPETFARIPDQQQAAALAALQQLPQSAQQDVLDEWAARCRTTAVRKPAAYLFGLIQRAVRGDFRIWAGQRSATPSSRDAQQSSHEASTEEIERRRAIAREQVEKLRSLLRMP